MCACVHLLLCVCGGDRGEERWMRWWMILSERPLLIVRTFFLLWDKWQQSSERQSRKDKIYKPQYREQLSPQWPEVSLDCRNNGENIPSPQRISNIQLNSETSRYARTVISDVRGQIWWGKLYCFIFHWIEQEAMEEKQSASREQKGSINKLKWLGKDFYSHFDKCQTDGAKALSPFSPADHVTLT